VWFNHQQNLEKKMREFLEYYDGVVPDPEHYPLQFAFYVKMYNLYLERKRDES